MACVCATWYQLVQLNWGWGRTVLFTCLTPQLGLGWGSWTSLFARALTCTKGGLVLLHVAILYMWCLTHQYLSLLLTSLSSRITWTLGIVSFFVSEIEITSHHQGWAQKSQIFTSAQCQSNSQDQSRFKKRGRGSTDVQGKMVGGHAYTKDN